MQKLNRSFIVGIVLNIVFVLAEAGAGFYYDSLALLSDAGHNLSDVVSLVLAMFALRLSMAKPSLQYTYGYKKKYRIGFAIECCHSVCCRCRYFV